MKSEGARLFKRFYSISWWSKTPKIWPKNDQILAVLGQILIKPSQINTFGSEESFLVVFEKELEMEGTRLLFLGSIETGRIK